MKFSVWLENNIGVQNPLYHGTSGKMFNKFDPKSLGKYDNGDIGVGIYLTPSVELAKGYAHQAERKTGQPPLVLVVWHKFQKTANFNDPNIKFLLRNAGVNINDLTTTQRGQGLSLPMAQLITQTLTKQGYDSAQKNSEVVCYNPKCVTITKAYPLNDEFISSQEELNGPAPKSNFLSKLWQR